jgi:hypothetical protein
MGVDQTKCLICAFLLMFATSHLYCAELIGMFAGLAQQQQSALGGERA